MFWRVRVLAVLVILGTCLRGGLLQAEVTNADRDLVTSVSQRLLAVVDTPKEGLPWPPRIEIIEDRHLLSDLEIGENEIQAVAGVIPAESDDQPVTSYIGVTPGMMQAVVTGDADCLAFILGHEMAHHLLGHTLEEKPAKTLFQKLVFGREAEHSADRLGAELALGAGYSTRGARAAWRRMSDLGLEYSSFEGFLASHPSWTDRLRVIDTERESLWRAMAAFQNGAVFLTLEQYPAAERCFRTVTREFSDCYEAWANLGYALLMQYCDGLETDDLRRFEVGQIVAGGFYRRPESLEVEVRGIDEELWWEAVGSLNQALRLKAVQPLAKANLGIAYLVHPAGKDVGIGQATRYLHEAAAAALADDSLDSLARAAVLINAGVVDAAQADPAAALDRFTEAEDQIKRHFAGRRPEPLGHLQLDNALLFNRAMLLAASSEPENRRFATEHLEAYLRDASPASLWWPVAYERYAALSKSLGLTPEPAEELRGRESPWRLVTSVTTASGSTLALGEPLEEVMARLNGGEQVPFVRGTNLLRVRYRSEGVELLATDRVLAIFLTGPRAPTLELQRTGFGSEAFTLRVGMQREKLERLLGNEVHNGYRAIDDPDAPYRFYDRLGLAVRVRDGRVERLVIARVPRKGLYGSR